MTQPDEYLPSGAANYDSFAGFADTSQSDYEDQINSQVGSAYGNLSGICDLLGQLPFFGGLYSLGGTTDSGVTGGMLTGVQSLADLLCGFATGTDSTGTTPQTLIAGVGDANTSVQENSFASGLLGMGSGDTLFGQLLSGITEFMGALCGLATGSTDVSSTTPQTVLDGASGFLDLGNGIFGGSATNAGGLFDWTDGWFGDLLGGLGDPFGLGTGSASMSIPVDSVAGLLGPNNIGASLSAAVDGVYQGLSGTTDTGVSLAAMTNSMSALAQLVNFLAGNSAAVGVNPPEITEMGTAGAHTYTIPAWADYLDVVCLGGGGGGHGCGFLWGDGGDGGNWNQVTLERDVDIPRSTPTLSVTVGAGGDGSSGSGSNGGTSSASGTGWAGISATGGAGATSASLDYHGKSPGNDTFDNVIYYGGLEQAGYFGADGNAPGGGGGGGTITFMSGGDGAPGAVWVLAYQALGS